MSWKTRIAKDEKLKSALRLASKEKSWGGLVEELLAMHSGRQSRSLFTSKHYLKATKISAAAMQDSAFRSRAVEILIEASIQNNILSQYVSRLSDYMKTEFVRELKEFATVSQKDSAIRSALDVLYEQLTAIENVIEVAQFIIEDIDKCSWSLSKSMDAIQSVANKGHEL